LRAPPPMFAGGSPKSHSVLRPTITNRFRLAPAGLNGFRGQRLNMLGSYAAHDHRKICDQEKKACIVFPAPAN